MTMALDRHLPVTVMAGLVPAIHAFASAQLKTWMPGTSPSMTSQSQAPLV